MKSFKRSKTSQAIIFKSKKVISPSKKPTNAVEKFEENIIFISSYIKQYLQESMIRQEKQKLNNQKNGKEIDSSNNIEINTNILDFGTIKYILNKPKRSLDEILIIKTYLSFMSFLSTLKIPISNDRLLYSLSVYLKMEKKSKNTMLFRFGNKGNKFYIVLEGEVSILILKETKAEISFKRFFVHLLLLKMLKEDELIKKTISANSKMNYHFDDKDFDGYYEKIVKFASKNFNKNRVFYKKKKVDLEENDNVKINEN